MERIKGKDITHIAPVAGNYGHGYLWVTVKDKMEYRIHVSELLPIMQGLEYEVEMKRKYKHLKVCN